MNITALEQTRTAQIARYYEVQAEMAEAASEERIRLGGKLGGIAVAIRKLELELALDGRSVEPWAPDRSRSFRELRASGPGPKADLAAGGPDKTRVVSSAPSVSAEDVRTAKIAHLLAAGVRAGDIAASDARRIVLHGLRRRNTNNKLTIHPRSRGAQVAIEKYAPQVPPKNGSPEALHADHFDTIASEDVAAIDSLDRWIEAIASMRSSVVCVTAEENYSLMTWERQGVLGPEKYARAGIDFVDRVPWEGSRGS